MTAQRARVMGASDKQPVGFDGFCSLRWLEERAGPGTMPFSIISASGLDSCGCGLHAAKGHKWPEYKCLGTSMTPGEELAGRRTRKTTKTVLELLAGGAGGDAILQDLVKCLFPPETILPWQFSCGVPVFLRFGRWSLISGAWEV